MSETSSRFLSYPVGEKCFACPFSTPALGKDKWTSMNDLDSISVFLMEHFKSHFFQKGGLLFCK